MKEAMHKTRASMAVLREGRWKRKIRVTTTCAVCTCRIWFSPLRVTEPEDAPEPRQTWTLCKPCFQALLAEMRRSPVRSPLRIRIAMGLVASERWPQAYSTRVRLYISDRRWIIFIAASFIVAMLFHLALIVMLPLITK